MSFIKKIIGEGASLIFTLIFTLGKFVKQRKGIQREILFITRQSSIAPQDFQLLDTWFRKHNFHTRICAQPFRLKHPFTSTWAILKQAYYLGLSDICFIDRFTPVISLTHFSSKYSTTDTSATTPWKTYPTSPVIIQLWHAFGAFKKFGFPAINTPEGRKSSDITHFKIHKNYSWIICSGESNREKWAQAIGYPKERVCALGRPLLDELKSIKNDAVIHTKRDNTFRILIAPTLRRNPASPHPFKELYRQREIFSHIAAPHGMNIEFIWRFHPNDPHIHAAELPDTSHVGVHEVDMIITDYSSIFYEAAFFEKYVLFYVPDLNAFKAT
ncbi:MAG: CDP-glycerol glycerophosphotransferase family protein, partial [Eggerthellaceae bacterium]|nr:CDP-glycerol glycerophosphotransferase family protein [Eggerthellaceae bacterium]